MTLQLPKFQESAFDTIESITGVKKCEDIRFLSTPYFKKYYARHFAISSDPTLDAYEKAIHFYSFYNYVNNVAKFSHIWSDIPNDHFQNNLEFLESSAFLRNVNCDVIRQWMNTNLKYESFFNMIRTYLSKNKVQELSTNIEDTMRQLSEMLKKKVEVERPNRWRIVEFHDHISYQYLKTNTENKVHDNTLIPHPFESEDWTVRQPKDTIELTIWAQKVRNCVASYENSIFSGKCKIILMEQDKKPTYTVEIDPNVKNGIMIKQMVGHCNRHVDNNERQFASKLIESAIEHYNPKKQPKAKKTTKIAN
jgi:PcfJ-like protein